MKDFDRFVKKYPEKIAGETLSPAVLKKVATKVSADYADFLKQHGVAGYDKGFIWSVNPFDYKEVLEDYQIPADEVHVVARTAFGDLFIWTGKDIALIQVHYNQLFNFDAESVAYLYDQPLTDGPFLDKLQRDLFTKALKRLGPLKHDECYGYVLPLVAGGKEGVEQLQKMEVIPHLSLMAQWQQE